MSTGRVHPFFGRNGTGLHVGDEHIDLVLQVLLSGGRLLVILEF